MSIRPCALLLALLIVAATATPANPVALSSDQLERLERRGATFKHLRKAIRSLDTTWRQNLAEGTEVNTALTAACLAAAVPLDPEMIAPA